MHCNVLYCYVLYYTTLRWVFWQCWPEPAVIVVNMLPWLTLSLHCTVAVYYCTALHCCCVLLHFTALSLCNIALQCTYWYFTALHHTEVQVTAPLHWIYCIILQGCALHCNNMNYILHCQKLQYNDQQSELQMDKTTLSSTSTCWTEIHWTYIHLNKLHCSVLYANSLYTSYIENIRSAWCNILCTGRVDMLQRNFSVHYSTILQCNDSVQCFSIVLYISRLEKCHIAYTCILADKHIYHR